MKEATTIGLDLAKNLFQFHGIDGSGTDRDSPAAEA